MLERNRNNYIQSEIKIFFCWKIFFMRPLGNIHSALIDELQPHAMKFDFSYLNKVTVQ